MFSQKSSAGASTTTGSSLWRGVNKNAFSMLLLFRDNQGKALGIFGMYCALTIVFAAAAKHASGLPSSGCVAQVCLQVAMGIILCVGIALTCLSVKQVEKMRSASKIDGATTSSTIKSGVRKMGKGLCDFVSNVTDVLLGHDDGIKERADESLKERFVRENGVAALVAPVFIVPSVSLAIGMCFSIASCASGNSYVGTVSLVCNALGAALMLIGACLVGAGIAYDEYTKCSAENVFREIGR